MSGVATAIGGAAVVGYLGSKSASGAAGTATKDAAAINERTADKDRAFAEQQYADSQANYAPYLSAGNTGLSGLTSYANQGYGGYIPGQGDYGDPNIGFNAPDAGSFGIDPRIQQGRTYLDSPDVTRWGGNTNLDANVYKDPSFEFRRQQGQQGVSNSASAGGMTLSGAALKDLTRFNQDYASTEYGKAYDRADRDFTRLQGQDRDYFGAQRQVGLDQFGARQSEADRQYAAAVGDYGREYGAAADMYGRQDAQAMDFYNTDAQNWSRSAGLTDKLFDRSYGMWNDEYSKYKNLADYGSAAAANQSAAGASASNTLAGIGSNQMYNTAQTGNTLAQINSAAAMAPVNTALGAANVGLSAYGMMNQPSPQGYGMQTAAPQNYMQNMSGYGSNMNLGLV